MIHGRMIYARVVRGSFRLGSGSACIFGYLMPHRAMGLGFLLALCLGSGLRPGTLLLRHC